VSARVRTDKGKESHLVIVLSLSLVLGMAVALGVYFGWTAGAIPPSLNHPLTALALLVCPPFVLSLIVAPNPDSALALVLVVGTIVFANGFLYSGVGAAVYFIVGVFVGRRREGG
jgi:hypothetical protein